MTWVTATTWTISEALTGNQSNYTDHRVWGINAPGEPQPPDYDWDWEPYASGVIVSGEGRDQRCIRWTAWRRKR